jgi:hypothetical protein
MYTSSDSSNISDSDGASQADSEADVALLPTQMLDILSDVTEVSLDLQCAQQQHSISLLSSSSSSNDSSNSIIGKGESLGDVADDVAQRALSSHQLALSCSKLLPAAPAKQQQ